MQFFKLDHNKTKEENLQLAKDYSDKATELKIKFEEILAEVNKEFKPDYMLTASKKRKAEQPTEAYQRLLVATRKHRDIVSFYETNERMEAEKIKKAEIEAKQKKLEAKQKELLNEAIQYCIENGCKFGIDVNIDNAIQTANNIAFDKEVLRREDEIGSDYISFSGQNCEDECAGWNPSSNRCECGNRRVDWTDGDTSDFRDMTIYAEAY